LRTRGVNIISCPSCSRQGFDVIATVQTLEERLAHISEPITLSIIGCVVNGPGEAAMTDLGFTGGGKESGMMYVSGRPDHKLSNADMVEHIVAQVEAKAERLREQRESEATETVPAE
ncbi:MAG: flavodoxin-dependent (E)-4-hydroxy-3-methylbut-2-enyl-diphosphate synthase, partial [Pseudomonadota bacterium]